MYKKLFILNLLLTYFFTGCFTQKEIVKEQKMPESVIPYWFQNPPSDNDKSYYFTGIKSYALTPEAGLRDAKKNTDEEITEMIRSNVKSDYDKLQTEAGIIEEIEVRGGDNYVRNRMKSYSSEIINGAKIIKKHYQKVIMKPNKVDRFNCYVLVQYPSEEYTRIKRKILGIDPEIDEGIECLTNKQPCLECVEHFNNLITKNPDNEQAHYYLALAYDNCDMKNDALHAYQRFIGMKPRSKTLKNMAVNQINKRKEIKIDKLIKEADSLALNHIYDTCFVKLKEAYNLNPSKEIIDEIENKSREYAIDSIAYKFSYGKISVNPSISTKNVAVLNFTDRQKNKIEDGISVASKLTKSLINLNIMKVYERDSLKEILKEIERGEIGLIDKETRKKLKLVGVDILVQGWIDQIKSRKEIYATLEHVETAEIISAEYVELLGWEIEDTKNDSEFNISNNFDISVETDKKSYKLNETLTVQLKSNKDCYVYLLNIRSNNKIYQIFPNEYDLDNFIKAGMKYSIPNPKTIYDMSIMEPTGTDHIKVIATTRRVELKELDDIISKDTNLFVDSNKKIVRDSNSVFREISTTEMRGWNKLLKTRGSRNRGVGPKLKEGLNYKVFNSAVSSCSFETVN